MVKHSRIRVALNVVALVFLGVVTESAIAAPSGTSTPDADDFLAGARLLDGRAAALEARASTKLQRAENEDARVTELRAEAAKDQGGRAPSLRARADDLEVVTLQLRANATREQAEAKAVRTRAGELRARAKEHVAQPRNAKRARLDVASRLGCEVEVDGVPRGTAPMVGLAVAEGSHVVTCKTEGPIDHKRTIQARADKTATVTFEGTPVLSPESF